jgi:hypothetical protein
MFQMTLYVTLFVMFIFENSSLFPLINLFSHPLGFMVLGGHNQVLLDLFLISLCSIALVGQ